MNKISKNTPGINVDELSNIIKGYSDSLYLLYMIVLVPVLMVFIGKDVYKYFMADEDERESKELFKKIGKKIAIGIFLMFLPTILRAFGLGA